MADESSGRTGPPPCRDECPELDELRAAAAGRTRDAHGGVLPDGYRLSWRRYGLGGRWRGKGPHGWIECSTREIVEMGVWLLVFSDEDWERRRAETSV